MNILVRFASSLLFFLLLLAYTAVSGATGRLQGSSVGEVFAIDRLKSRKRKSERESERERERESERASERERERGRGKGRDVESECR